MTAFPRHLRALLEGILEVPADCDVAITDLTTDSRDVCPGAAFIALPGLRQDARHFVPQALAQGARVVLQLGEQARIRRDNQAVLVELPDLRDRLGLLAQRAFGDASARLSLLGVTGTNGKSSVTHFIAQLLTALGQPCAVIGTLGYGFPHALQEASHTTPDTLRLHREIARLEQEGARAVAMEVSSHALDQARVAGLRFQGAVFTNLSRDHLDYHGDMESYGSAKARLFQRDELAFAVVNLDDVWGQRIAANWPSAKPLLTFSLRNPEADLRATDICYRPGGFTAELSFRGESGRLQCNLVGDFNVSNVLAALGTLLSLGHPLAVLLNCAENLQPVAGRMQLVQAAGGPIVIVDYAHTPDALDQALQACAQHQPSRIWCVFGCGGDRDRGKRPLMAASAARHGARLVVTDDNPRTESPQHIVQDILAGIPDGMDVQVQHDREQAIAWAIAQADDNDMVLIAGKGHEPYQEIHGIRKPFSDVAVAQRYLQQRVAQEVIR